MMHHETQIRDLTSEWRRACDELEKQKKVNSQLRKENKTKQSEIDKLKER